ncbi:MAG TPA: hypothetical protein VFA32_00755 [Dehalococcoidia bacterium]|nr:hypothetical protein [Dehalococcoidia bacterium]
MKELKTSIPIKLGLKTLCSFQGLARAVVLLAGGALLFSGTGLVHAYDPTCVENVAPGASLESWATLSWTLRTWSAPR